MTSNVWTFNGVVNVQIHDAANDCALIEMKHFDDIDYNLQELSGYIADIDFDN